MAVLHPSPHIPAEIDIPKPVEVDVRQFRDSVWIRSPARVRLVFQFEVSVRQVLFAAPTQKNVSDIFLYLAFETDKTALIAV